MNNFLFIFFNCAHSADSSNIGPNALADTIHFSLAESSADFPLDRLDKNKYFYSISFRILNSSIPFSGLLFSSSCVAVNSLISSFK